MKILMTCGGTGGHINPAIAIANRIKALKPDTIIEFVGTKNGMEAKILPKNGYKIDYVEVRGFKRKLSLQNIDAAIKSVTSVFTAKKIIKNFKPNVVIGTGGYVSWPTVKAAAKMNIPTLIQEQNMFPGVTQKMLAKYADKICVSFDESKNYFDKKYQSKICLTGNPVRAFDEPKNLSREKLGITATEFYIVSSGGSLGAEKVNEYVFELIEKYLIPSNIRIMHATGSSGFEKYSKIAAEKGFNAHENIKISEYIFDMQRHINAADAVIGRAGASTISENTLLKKAMILIPSPNVTDDHQYKNAKVLSDAGAAICLRESETRAIDLINEVKSLITNQSKRQKLEEAAAKYATPNADDKIAKIAIKLTGQTVQTEL